MNGRCNFAHPVIRLQPGQEPNIRDHFSVGSQFAAHDRRTLHCIRFNFNYNSVEYGGMHTEGSQCLSVDEAPSLDHQKHEAHNLLHILLKELRVPAICRLQDKYLQRLEIRVTSIEATNLDLNGQPRVHSPDLDQPVHITKT